MTLERSMADDYVLAARNKIASAKRHLAALNKLRAGEVPRAGRRRPGFGLFVAATSWQPRGTLRPAPAH